MTKCLFSAALVVVVSGATAVLATASDAGWITMFDGQTFGDWKPNERPESWQIEDGAIVAHGSRSHLYYMRRAFTDFHFQAEVMTEKGSNSGIFFHTAFVATGWPVQGYECQVNNTHGDPVKTGSLYHTVALLNAEAQDNKWFVLEILVKGKRIIVKIDGRKVIDYAEPEGKEGPIKLGQGLFALQAHDPGSVVRYRNLKVRPLPAGAARE